MRSNAYEPTTLLPVYHRLLAKAAERLPESMSAWLTPAQSVIRHGTHSSVLVWRCWHSRESAVGLDPLYCNWNLNFDPDHFYSDREDWVLQWYINTYRVPRNNQAVRRHLESRLRTLAVPGFTLKEHPRELRLVREFDHPGSPGELVKRLSGPLARLIEATFPILEEVMDLVAGASGPDLVKARKPGRTSKAVSNAGGPLSRAIPPALRRRVLEHHGWRCGICGGRLQEGEEIHIDHVVAWSNGGLTHLENLQPSHPRCNLQKGSGKRVPPGFGGPAKKRNR